jgi:hypothetical protein
MVERLSETMPMDVRQAFDDAVRLYSHWRSGTSNVPAPTLSFRALTVSLSGYATLLLLTKTSLCHYPFTTIFGR